MAESKETFHPRFSSETATLVKSLAGKFTTKPNDIIVDIVELFASQYRDQKFKMIAEELKAAGVDLSKLLGDSK